jgi:hypothetical protein
MSNPAKHTPQPWAYEEETGRVYHADGDVEPTVAVVDLDNTSPEQAKADGCLIAAAPKALAALLAFIEADAMAQECGEWKWESLDHAFGLARDALAEANRPGTPSAPATNEDASSRNPGRFEIEHNPEDNPDRVYVLVDGKFDVAIIRTDEGVVVDVYPKDGFETIATSYAFDSDVEPESSTN